MSEVSSINTRGAVRVDSTARAAESAASTRQEAKQSGVSRGEDRVELSSVAQYLQQLRDNGVLRVDLIDRVRQEIGEGRYDTPQRLDAALNEMLRDESEIG